MRILCTRPWDEWEKKAIREVVEDAEFLEPGPERKLQDLVLESDVLYGFPQIPMSALLASKTLKLLHVQSTGVDRFAPLLKDSPIILTNSRGVHAKPVAEHAVALMISLAYNFRAHTKLQKEGVWKDPGIDRLEGKTAGLIGLGAIGRVCERGQGPRSGRGRTRPRAQGRETQGRCLGCVREGAASSRQPPLGNGKRGDHVPYGGQVR